MKQRLLYNIHKMFRKDDDDDDDDHDNHVYDHDNNDNHDDGGGGVGGDELNDDNDDQLRTSSYLPWHLLWEKAQNKVLYTKQCKLKTNFKYSVKFTGDSHAPHK